MLFGESDQTAAQERWSFAFGMCVVSDQASAAGITAIPTPDIDAVSDLWFVYERMIAEFLFSDSTGEQEGAGLRKEVDSRAMRKVEEGEDVVVVVENGATTSNGAICVVAGRLLIKLH